ncbi:MAG: hypothetical protein ABSG67_03585 [Thermoguttaceae bacterium]
MSNLADYPQHEYGEEKSSMTKVADKDSAEMEQDLYPEKSYEAMRSSPRKKYKRPPGCEQFAVVLGQKPKITILAAKVVNTKEVEHDDQQMYLVGCQFIDRIQK